MKKLRVAIIGQGRSGRNIHGSYFLGETNKNCEVVAVVDAIEYRREKAKREFGCKVFETYQELFDIKDEIDVVVNSTFSQMHYPITMDLLNHGMNVVCEKPFGANYKEAMDMVEAAKKNNVKVFPFHQSLLPDNIVFMRDTVKSGKLGEIVTMDLKYNSYLHRYDWQTLQCCVAGGLYNSGPHPVGIALFVLGEWDKAELVYSDLRCINTAGDSDDYARIVMRIPGGTTAEVEVSSTDLIKPVQYKIQGTLGTLTMNGSEYHITYVLPEEQDLHSVIKESLADENGDPAFCKENIIRHEESGTLESDPFSGANYRFYNAVYDTLFNGVEFPIKGEDVANVVRIIDEAHKQNPLPVKYTLD